MQASFIARNAGAIVRSWRWPALLVLLAASVVGAPKVFANHCDTLTGGGSFSYNIGAQSPTFQVQLNDVADSSGVTEVPVVWKVEFGYPNTASFPGSQQTVVDGNPQPGGTSSESVNLGNSAGNATLTASACGQQVIFDISLLDPATLSKAGGDTQSGAPGAALQPMIVHQTGGGTSGETYQITWQVTSGDAVFTANNSSHMVETSLADQDASAVLRLGTAPGAVAVSATLQTVACETIPCMITDIGSVSFSAINSNPPQLQKVSGDGQSGAPNSALPNPLTVKVVASPFGAIPTADLQWQVVSGDAKFAATNSANYTQTGVAANTDSSATLNLGNTPGPVTISVSCAQCGNTTVSFSATVNAPDVIAPILVKISGDAQIGPPGSALASPLTVLVNDAGSGLKTVDIVWQINGDASFAANGSKSYTQTGVGVNSNANVSINLGNTPGTLHITATCAVCAGQPADFTATVASAQLVKVSGDGATGAAGATLPLVARVNYSGTDFQSVTLIWSITAGSASFSSGASTFQQSNVAINQDDTVKVRLGDTAGPVSISVVCDKCANTISFSLTNGTGGGSNGATQLVKASGDLQTGAVGAPGDAPLVVQLLDGRGQPVSGQSVTWQIVQGQGSVDTAAATTDTQGHAQTTFHYGAQAGPIVVRASSGTLNVDFSISSFVPVLTIASGDAQTAPVGTTLPLPLTVMAASPAAPTKGLSALVVAWTIVDGGGSLTAATTTTDALGNTGNTLKLGPTPGLNHVQATLAGGAHVVFSATGTLVGAKLTALSGTGQVLPTYQPSQPLVVQLNDAQGKPISGIQVQWSAPAHSSLSNTSGVTDANGKTSTVVTIELPGTVSVSVQAVGVTTTPVVFTLNGGVANVAGLTPTETAVAKAIDAACTALTLQSTTTGKGQSDLLARCTELVKNAGGNPQPIAHALDAMLNSEVTPQISTGRSMQTAQIDNLNSRLDALRHGQQGMSAQGLAYSNGTQALPLDLLGSLMGVDKYRKDPQGDKDIGSDFSRWGFFATGTYAHGSGDARVERPGFSIDNAGLTAGIDYRFSDRLVAGVALGYGHNSTDIDRNAGSAAANGYSLSAYATWYQPNDIYIDAAFTQSWTDYDLSRSIIYQIADGAGGTTAISQIAKASPGGEQSSVALSFGKYFHREALEWNPFVRAQYLRVSLDGFDEVTSDPTGPGGGLAMHADSHAQTDLLGILGLHASYAISRDWGILLPNAQLEWNHEFDHGANNAVLRFINDPTGTPIALSDPRTNANFFTLGVGINIVLPQGRSGYILLQHTSAAQGVTEDRISIGGRMEF